MLYYLTAYILILSYSKLLHEAKPNAIIEAITFYLS